MAAKTAGFVLLPLLVAITCAGCAAGRSAAPGASAGSGAPGASGGPVAPAGPSYSDPDALQTLISKSTEPYYLVDVRTSDEYETGHIPTAINIPYDTIGDKPPTPYKTTLIIVYCASGVRSAKAKATLDKLGYSRVVDFGGITRWKGQSVKGTDAGECPCRTL